MFLGVAVTVSHFIGEKIVPRIVTTPSLTENLIISWVVDGTAWISLIPGLPIISLYGDGDLTIIKFIHASVECSASPIVTKSLICPIGHIVSPLKPVSDVVAWAIWLWISGRSRLKQCSKSTSIEEPWKRIFKKRNKKKAKSKQIQAWSGNGKVKSHQNEENTT
ncbi:hypothetical protein Tco_1055234 [Tanacetum coccineum]|uniref:Uncharacterized protein n=1 Tax=Tanacetum coccineum TaxID=301880 RepID=A0ABQ5H0X2_9ASTR